MKIERKQRFNGQANRVYRVPVTRFNAVKDNPNALMELAYQFIQNHENYQVPRIQELKRYYLAQNDIKNKQDSPNPYHSNNKIASAFARYITNIRVGYFLGNDIQFKVQDTDSVQQSVADKLGEQLETFNQTSDESYIEEQIKKDLSVCGRAYDLVFVNPGETTLNLAIVDPETAFVVYDDSVKEQPLFAVRYYQTGVLDNDLVEQYEIYTSDTVFRFHTDGGFPEMNTPMPYAVLDSQEPLFFGRVPMTEYYNNDERTGDWEPELDLIDALDDSVSSMADFQDDFDNANIILTGKFANLTEPVYKLDKDGKKVIGADGQPIVLEPAHPNVNPHNHLWYLEPYAQPTGINGGRAMVNPDAKYLTKTYDSAGWKEYTDFLIGEVHKYTNTPNVNDPNFASNASGVAMSYKLWGADQERKIQEALYKKGLFSRLCACVAYWQKLNILPQSVDTATLAQVIQPNFVPNLPKNDQETALLVQTLNATGLFSAETLRELAEPITGVSADTEQQRGDDETVKQQNATDAYNQGVTGIGKVFATGEPAVVDQPAKGDDDEPAEAD